MALPGDLDTTFGGGGKVTTGFGSGADGARAVAIQLDGKIVAAGASYNGSNNDFALTRYNADGSLDTSFGSGGKVTTAIGGGDDDANAIAIQPNGKIVAAGYSVNGSNYDFALTRYNSNGSLDTSFGGDGIVTTGFGAGYDVARAVVIQSDGKIVAAGFSDAGVYPSGDDFALARYNTDGSLDTSFSGDGKLTTAIGAGYDVAYAVAIQPDGKIVAAGYSDVSTGDDFALTRYNTDGSLDTSFSGDGMVTTVVDITSVGHNYDFAEAVVIQSDGKIVAAGEVNADTGTDFALVRYNTDGSLDTSFDGDGRLTTAIGAGYDAAYAVAIQSNGKIVAAGSGHNGTNNDFALARYNTDGSLDTSFDGDGKLMTAFGSGADVAYAVAIQPDGKIVAAGRSYNGSSDDFALVRYMGDSPAAPAVSITPTTNDFGSQNISAGPSATQDFVVTNTGDATLNISTAALSGTDPSQFNITVNGCTGAAVAPAAACTVTVNFDPYTAGAKTADLQFVDDAAGSPHTAALTGTGTAAPAVSITPSTKAFGAQDIGAGPASTQDFVVTNTGNATLNISTAALSGTDPSQFNITVNGCTGAAVAPAAACTVRVNFDPSTAGVKTADLQFVDDAAGSPHTAALTGTGTVAPAVLIAPSDKAFGAQDIGAGPTSTQDFVVTNTGDATLNISTAALSGADPSQFNITVNGCTGAAVAPAAACTVTVNFDPSTAGVKIAGLQFVDDAAGSPHTAALAGTGTVAPAVLITPSTKAFGNQDISAGPTSTQDFVVTNTGSGDLHVAGPGMTGADVSQFNIPTDSCTSVTVAPGGTCTITANFDPTTTGEKTATLTVIDDAADSPQAAALTGTGTGAPVLSVTPASKNFGAQDIDAGATATQNFMVTNTGNVALNISGAALTGADSSEFSLSSNNCGGASLAPGGSCSVVGSFDPSTAGTKSAALSFTDNAAGSPQTVPLSGTGTVTTTVSATITPSTKAFGNQDIDAGPTSTQDFVVTNTGSGDLHVAGPGMTGADVSQFTVTTNSCTSVTVAPGGTCTITANFDPTTTGEKTATLTVIDDAADSPQTAELTGTATATVSATITPDTHSFGDQDISAGPTLTQDFVVTNTGSGDLHVERPEMTGADVSQFVVTTDSCTLVTVAPGGTCTITAEFDPTTTGEKTATLTVIDDAADSPQTAELTGTATATVSATITPDTHSFGDQDIDAGSAVAQDFVVTNTGSGDLHVEGREMTGADVSQFIVTTDSCTLVTVAPGGTCTITAEFDPSTTGDKAASLVVVDDAADSPQTAELTGTGTENPVLSVTPASKNFGAQDIGSGPTATQNFTVTNTGNVALDIVGAALTGTDSSEFSLSSNNCGGASLAPGGSCSVVGSFDPSTAGTKSAALSFTDNAAGSPQTVSLSGVGTSTFIPPLPPPLPLPPPPPTLPQNTRLPKISGKAKVGEKLRFGTTTWTGTAPITYNYQWLRCGKTSASKCAPIKKATKLSYKLTRKDSGHRLRFKIVAENSAGKITATTKPTAVVKK